MNLVDAARAYLGGDALEWLAFSKAVASALSRSADADVEPQAVREIRGQIVSQILEPDLIHTVALTRSMEEAKQILEETLRDFLGSAPLHVSDENSDLIEYQGGKLERRKLWEGWPLAREWPATLRGFSPAAFEAKREAISGAIKAP